MWRIFHVLFGGGFDISNIFPFAAQVVMNTSNASINTHISKGQRANFLIMIIK